MLNANYINLLMNYSHHAANQARSTYLDAARHESVHAVRRQSKAKRAQYLAKLLKK